VREQKRRVAKAVEKAETLNIGVGGSKTYADQIFDFIRVYDPRFMALQSNNDGNSVSNASEAPPDTFVIAHDRSKPHFRPAFAHQMSSK
jgi:hypothetical protein